MAVAIGSLLLACTKNQPEVESCDGDILFQQSYVRLVNGFMPMDTRYYWLYADTNFLLSDSTNWVTSERLMTPRNAFVFANGNGESPIIMQNLYGGFLGDLSFFRDTVYLNGGSELRHGDCFKLGRPILFPLEIGDTVLLANANGPSDTLYRSSEPVTTLAGTFTDNYVLLRSFGQIKFVFNREVGLLEERVITYGENGPRLIRRLALTQAAIQ